MSKIDIFVENLSADELEFFNEDFCQTAAIQKAADIVHDALRERNLSQKALAEMAGVSQGYISRILSGAENLTVRSVAKILFALGKEYVQSSKDRHKPKYKGVYFLPEPTNHDSEDLSPFLGNVQRSNRKVIRPELFFAARA